MRDTFPAFADGVQHLGKEESLRDDPAFWSARALLIGQYEADPDRLTQMVHSTCFGHAQSRAEWRAMAEAYYPEPPLADGEMSRYANEDVPVRAFVLKQAILSLFELNGAPARMKHDLEKLLDSFLDNPARTKAKVQTARLQHPDMSWAEVCRLVGADYRQVKRDKQHWVIAHLPTEGARSQVPPPAARGASC